MSSLLNRMSCWYKSLDVTGQQHLASETGFVKRAGSAHVHAAKEASTVHGQKAAAGVCCKVVSRAGP